MGGGVVGPAAPPGPHRTVRESLDSHGSYRPDVLGITPAAHWENSSGCRLATVSSQREALLLSANHHCNTPTNPSDDHSPGQCVSGESAWDNIVNFDLSELNIAPGSPAMIQLVDGNHRGEAIPYGIVDANQRLTFYQPGPSVALITIPWQPFGPVPEVMTVLADADAYVRAGRHRGSNVGSGSNLYVYANRTDAQAGAPPGL